MQRDRRIPLMHAHCFLLCVMSACWTALEVRGSQPEIPLSVLDNLLSFSRILTPFQLPSNNAWPFRQATPSLPKAAHPQRSSSTNNRHCSSSSTNYGDKIELVIWRGYVLSANQKGRCQREAHNGMLI
ncbi:hypothetical protein DPX16_12418 [Anabarilius grahami]|uniref:Secreted protein n=1 Tax=Anabarilius grahami TaxID=495550 RepID=A0A3N0XG41_ANAGA|nr:hypothetical protein DPX16_12418 [Anabarilius grahami]